MAALAVSGVIGAGACGTSESSKEDLVFSPAQDDEQARTVEAMRPPKRARPVIAVIAQNEGTETTDFLIPYAVLKQSDAADVIAVAPQGGAIKLTPALAVNAESTLADFDARYPDGADYVVVPKIETNPDLWTVEVSEGVDEIALGFTADAWSRTMRSKAIAVGDDMEPIIMRRGLELIPEGTTEATASASDLSLVTALPATALPISLDGIEDQYDTETAAFVALQLEYAWARD
jgi:putative intracellular protease/amidase